MKKIICAIAMLSVAFGFASCNKGGQTPDTPKIQKRLKMCGDEWDKYVFTYNQDGTLNLVNRNEGERTWTFTWAGKVGTAKYVKEGEALGDWVFTLGDNGYLATFADEWEDTYGFTYDSNGYLLKITRPDRENAVKCNNSWKNGDLEKWSRFKDDGTEEWKLQSFLADENVAGIFADVTDKTDVPRWVFELGLLGKPSKHLLDEALWEGSTSKATHQYEKDEDGFVTKVSKYYDGELDQTFEYEWETIK